MTNEDVTSLKELHANLKKVGDLAVKHQVRVFVDAEHTYAFSYEHPHRDLLMVSISLVGISQRLMHSVPT
jgi:hypothetical protein